MLKPPVLLFLAVMSAGQLPAQSFFIGVRAGQASSRQQWRGQTGTWCSGDECFGSFTPGGTTESRLRNVASGLSATLDFGPWIALEGDLLYAQKGMRDNGVEMQLEYLELPVLLRLSTPISDYGVHLFLHGGPAPSIEIACSTRGQTFVPGSVFELGNASGRVIQDCGALRATRRDFGWAYGTGVLLRRRQYQMTMSWRRTRGTRDIDSKRDLTARVNDTNAFLIGFVAARN